MFLFEELQVFIVYLIRGRCCGVAVIILVLLSWLLEPIQSIELLLVVVFVAVPYALLYVVGVSFPFHQELLPFPFHALFFNLNDSLSIFWVSTVFAYVVTIGSL